MEKLTDQQQRLLEQIRVGINPICIHILGQGLANELAAIVKHLDNRLEIIEQNDMLEQEKVD